MKKWMPGAAGSRVRFAIAAFGLSALMSACQPAVIGPIDTTGFQPAITTDVSAARIKTFLVTRAVIKKNLVVADTPGQLVIEMPSNDFMYSVVFGRPWNPTARARVTYLFSTDQTGRTHVTASAAIYANEGTGLRQVISFEDNADVKNTLQRVLEEAAEKAR